MNATYQSDLKPRRAFTLAEVVLITLALGLLMTTLLPAINACRGAVRRSVCKNHMMQLGVALHSYHLTHDSFPPGCVNSTQPILNVADGYHASWIVQLLPYLEESNVARYRNVELSVYDSKQIEGLTTHRIPLLSCPEEEIQDQWQHSNYRGVTGGINEPILPDNLGIFMLNSCVAQKDILDGTSQTLMIGECRLPSTTQPKMTWLSGTTETLRNCAVTINVANGNSFYTPEEYADRISARTASIQDWQTGGFSSYHQGGVQFLLADGSVRFLSENLTADVYSMLANRHDGGPRLEW